jgi:gamma-glutamyltranspeptidase/glutathione hydrolase
MNRFSFATLLTLALLTHSDPARGDHGEVEWPHGVVTSAHPLSSEACASILREGGNVVEPHGSGLGGGGFAVVLSAENGETASLDFRETAPAKSVRDMYLVDGRADPELSRTGGLAVAVPGFVRGMETLHRSHGELKWALLLAPAIQLATEGFPVDRILADRITLSASRFNDAAKQIFMPAGEALGAGDPLIQRDLARTLQRIADAGADVFYTGTIAASIAATTRRAGGILTEADLANWKATWRAPVRGAYRGMEIVSMPPPSSGGVHLIQMLHILEGFDLKAAGYGSARAWHWMAEAMKFAYADRSLHLGDPDFHDVPVERLISRPHADAQRARIRTDGVVPFESVGGIAIELPEGDNTSHLSVIDRHGNAVASTLTINLSFGSGLVAKGTGVVLNDEMDDFAAAPGVPNAFGLVGSEANAIGPGKRPLSSMTPTIVLKEGDVFMVTGSPGGSRIITTVLQTILHVVDFGMDMPTAVRVPRIHHQWYPPVVYHEPFGISPDTARSLELIGHTLKTRGRIGNAQSILVPTAKGPRIGAGDPRGNGSSRGH